MFLCFNLNSICLILKIRFQSKTCENLNCRCVILREKAYIFSFIFQFLFERVEGISRATIIDLDAHQVSWYYYLSLCQYVLLLRSWHWWQDNRPPNPPLLNHHTNQWGSLWTKLALTVIFSTMYPKTSELTNGVRVFPTVTTIKNISFLQNWKKLLKVY